MSDTPRTDAYIEQFPGCLREPKLLDFCRRLEKQLAEARAEIERLALLAQNQQIVIDAQSRSIQAKDAQIEQMREALVAAKNDGKMQSAITYQLIVAALSAAEGGGK